MRWIGKSHNSFTPLCHYIKHPKNRSISTRNERENEWIRMSEEMNKERNIILSFETITNLIDSMRQLSKVFPFKTFIWVGEYESVMRMKWRRMNGVSESEYECEWEYDKNEVSVMNWIERVVLWGRAIRSGVRFAIYSGICSFKCPWGVWSCYYERKGADWRSWDSEWEVDSEEYEWRIETVS